MDIQMTDSEKLNYYQNCMRSLIGKCEAPKFDVVNGFGNDILDKVSAYISVFRADGRDKDLRYEFSLLLALFHNGVKLFNSRWREVVGEDHPNYIHYRHSLDHAYDAREDVAYRGVSTYHDRLAEIGIEVHSLDPAELCL